MDIDENKYNRIVYWNNSLATRCPRENKILNEVIDKYDYYINTAKRYAKKRIGWNLTDIHAPIDRKLYKKEHYNRYKYSIYSKQKSRTTEKMRGYRKVSHDKHIDYKNMFIKIYIDNNLSQLQICEITGYKKSTVKGICSSKNLTTPSLKALTKLIDFIDKKEVDAC